MGRLGKEILTMKKYVCDVCDMCMTRQSAILITGSHRERLLRICRTTGYARCVVSEKISFPLKAK